MRNGICQISAGVPIKQRFKKLLVGTGVLKQFRMIMTNNRADCPAYITHGCQMFGVKADTLSSSEQNQPEHRLEKLSNYIYDMVIPGKILRPPQCWQEPWTASKGHDITDEIVSTISSFDILFPQYIRNRNGSGIGQNAKFLVTKNQGSFRI